MSSTISEIARGAAVNSFGLAIRAVTTPLLYILLTRLYGQVPLGTFLVAYSLLEVAGALGTSGFVDGGILYASRHSHSSEEAPRLYSAVRSLVVLTLVTSSAMLVLVWFGAPWVALRFYPEYDGLGSVLQILAFTLPFESLTRLATAFPKAQLRMGPEVLVLHFVAPVLTMIFAVVFYMLGWSTPGISAAFSLTYVFTLVYAIFLLRNWIDYRQLWKRQPMESAYGEILIFVIPQGLNQTFGRFISSMDVIMLGALGASPAQVAFYGLGAQIVKNVRQVKMVFSGSYGPVIARYYHEGRFAELRETLTVVSRWSIALGIPVIFFVSFFRSELLRAFDSGFTEDPTFMLLLLINPFLSCAFGMSGNVLVMSGFSRWNLLNSLLAGGLNFLFNCLLIPSFGLIGAAAATALSGTIVSVLQVMEARNLVGVRVPWRAILPWMGVGMLLFLWPFWVFGVSSNFMLKLMVCALLLWVYGWVYYRGSCKR